MILSVSNLSMTYDKKVLYQDASFRIFENEKVGVVGSNGVGKSTLINILNGEILPDTGTIEFNKNTRVGYLDQYAHINKKNTINEYLHAAFMHLIEVDKEMQQIEAQIRLLANNNQDDLQINDLVRKSTRMRDYLEQNSFYAIDSQIMRVCAGLGIVNYGMDTLVSHLSGGQKVKVILAKLLLENPQLLILDEPTNFLDSSHVDWLVKYLKEFKGAMIIVSHNQEFLNDVATVILDLDFGKITRYRGNYTAFLSKKAQMLENVSRRYEANQKERAKLQDYINRNKERAATANMAKSRQKKLDKMETIIIPKSKGTKLFLSFNYSPISSHRFLVVENLEIGYYFSLLPMMSFEVKSGEKLAITGFNGIGKTTLLKTIIGELKPISGEFRFVDDAKIAYFEQEHHFENNEITPLQEIKGIYPKMSDKEIRSELAKCALIGTTTLQPLKTLSGGELSKLKLCKVMLQKANVLVLDEPTNHLDSMAKESLIEALNKYQGTVIFVCHERDFISKVATRIFNIEDLLVS